MPSPNSFSLVPLSFCHRRFESSRAFLALRRVDAIAIARVIVCCLISRLFAEREEEKRWGREKK